MSRPDDGAEGPVGHDGQPLGWQFDFAAADEAARQLELTGEALLEAVAVLEADIPVVAEDWEGRFREVFDVESAMHCTAGRTLANDLLTLAAVMRANAVQAAAAWVP